MNPVVTLLPTSQVSAARTRQSPLPAAQGPGADFATVLRQEAQARRVDFSSGRLGLDLDRRGQPAKVVYFNEDGVRLRSSAFSAAEILKNANQLGIDLQDLRGLGEQLDSAGIGYRPYELYKGTGSDHGIDFEDLIKGGLGTAYDWRRDDQVAHKGPSATRQLIERQLLAQALNLQPNAQVTTERGIDPNRFEALAAPGEAPRRHVMFNGQVAAWYGTAEAARASATTYGGRTVELIQAPAVAVQAAANDAGSNGLQVPISGGRAQGRAIDAVETLLSTLEGLRSRS